MTTLADWIQEWTEDNKITLHRLLVMKVDGGTNLTLVKKIFITWVTKDGGGGGKKNQIQQTMKTCHTKFIYFESLK